MLLPSIGWESPTELIEVNLRMKLNCNILTNLVLLYVGIFVYDDFMLIHENACSFTYCKNNRPMSWGWWNWGSRSANESCLERFRLSLELIEEKLSIKLIGVKRWLTLTVLWVFMSEVTLVCKLEKVMSCGDYVLSLNFSQVLLVFQWETWSKHQ